MLSTIQGENRKGNGKKDGEGGKDRKEIKRKPTQKQKDHDNRPTASVQGFIPLLIAIATLSHTHTSTRTHNHRHTSIHVS